MKVRKLLGYLKGVDPNKEIFIASDEEMNSVFADGEVSEITGTNGNLVIYGHSGSEVRDDNFGGK